MARLLVAAMPPVAQVRIDNHDAVPASAGPIQVAPGSRRVRVSAPGHDTETRRVTFHAGRDTTLTFALVRIDTLPGAIAIDVRPFEYDSIYVDGDLIATGRPRVVVSAKPGTHRVRVAAAHHNREFRTVRVTGRDTARVSWVFPTGCLRVTSTTSHWGNVVLQGKDIGRRTGEVICNLLTGSYQVNIHRQGFRSREGDQTAMIQAGDTTEVTLGIARR
jgi:hypothetical protein